MVRFTELSAARRGARRKLAAATQGATRTSILATVIGIDPEDGSRLLVSVDPADPDLSVLAGPTKVVPGALVHVEVDSAGRPIRVLGPASTRPEGLDENAPAPAPIVPMEGLAPRELTEAEAQAIQDTADGLVQAQEDLSDAQGLLDAIGASDGPEGVAEALTGYLAIPLDQITVVDNRGADGDVVANLYDSIIVDGLLTASEIITAELLADGAVTARTLNVVPDEGTGGVEILPPGIRIIPGDAEAGTAVSLRTDEESWLTFAQDGATTFSVGPDGDAVAQSITANDSLTYRGVELSSLIDPRPRGLIARTMLDRNLTSDGAWCLLGEIKFTPEARRSYTAYLTYSVGSTEVNNIGAQVAVQFEGDGSTFRRSWGVPPWLVDPLRQSSGTVVYEFEMADLNLQADGTATLKFFGRSVVSGRQVAFHGWGAYSVDGTTACGVSLHDTGTRSRLEMQSGNQPPLIGSGGTTPPPTGGGGSKSLHSRDFYPAASRSYTGAGAHYTWNEAFLFHGWSPAGYGRLRSLAVFSRSAISAFTAGADMEEGTITLVNAHSWAHSGMTVRIGLTNHTSVPSTWTGTGFSQLAVTHVSRGGAVTLSLSQSQLNGIKAGTYNAVALDPGSNASDRYGYFRVSSTKLHLKVRK